jgi:uncharacterized protein (DUF433 family)
MTLPEFLSVDEFGHLRCAEHRVGLEDIVYYFNEGYSPEMIAGVFPTLPLSLVYKVIAFYLENRAEVDAYAENEREQAERHRALAGHGPSTDELRCRMEKMQRAEVP